MHKDNKVGAGAALGSKVGRCRNGSRWWKCRKNSSRPISKMRSGGRSISGVDICVVDLGLLGELRYECIRDLVSFVKCHRLPDCGPSRGASAVSEIRLGTLAVQTASQKLCLVWLPLEKRVGHCSSSCTNRSSEMPLRVTAGSSTGRGKSANKDMSKSGLPAEEPPCPLNNDCRRTASPSASPSIHPWYQSALRSHMPPLMEGLEATSPSQISRASIVSSN